MKPLPLREKEYRLSLLRTERRAIIPIKWFTLAVTSFLWIMLTEDSFSSLPVVLLFGTYGLFTFLETICLLFGLVGVDRVKPVALTSYLVDVVFVSLLIYFDTATQLLGEEPHSDFYMLFFLIVLRGFALFTSVLETALVNTLVSILFILTYRLQQQNFDFVADPEFAVKLLLIWLVVLMAWFIMVVLNQQKMDLLRVHDQLTRADNLARIGELAAGVAHEINNPIGIITATTEYLKKTMPADDPRLEDIETIHRESNRCKETIEQMLAYANPKASEVTYLAASRLNDEVLQFVFPKGRTGDIELLKEYGENLPPLLADPNLIKQALLNLYLNAQQAIIPKGKGKIISRIYGRRHPRQIVFDIEDDGVGVNPEDLDHVFDPFFTRKSTGTGLGLSVTQKIVESFGGSISMEPVSPRGTLVRMEFPVAEA